MPMDSNQATVPSDFTLRRIVVFGSIVSTILLFSECARLRDVELPLRAAGMDRVAGSAGCAGSG
jgi:hypothetical protein